MLAILSKDIPTQKIQEYEIKVMQQVEWKAEPILAARAYIQMGIQ